MSSVNNSTLCLPRPSSDQNPRCPVIVNHLQPTDIPPNHVLIKVDRFAFSANNITYQALGEHHHFRYFDYHPSPSTGAISPRTHGLVPVWGYGTIFKSTHSNISAGERVYGYFSPTQYLLVPVSLTDVNKYAFYVPRPHLPADRRPYNQILRCASDPQYMPTLLSEDLTMLYRPLFWTSYWCEDWLFHSNYRGGVSFILISSASSKTAFTLAYVIKKRIALGEINPNVKIIGLTSKLNVTFTNKLNIYHQVLDYESFTDDSLFHAGEGERWIYVDVAGNDNLNKHIFSHFASPYTGNLAYCITLGMTNLSPSSPNASSFAWSTDAVGLQTQIDHQPFAANENTSQFWPKMEQFFMVEWLNVRKYQISPAEIFLRQNQAWKEFMEDCLDWVKLERVFGAENVKHAYEDLVTKGLGPDKGFIWSLWDHEREAKNLARL